MRFLIVMLVVAFFVVDKLIPTSPLQGSIVSMSDLVAEPLPHYEATIALTSGNVSAIVYESSTHYSVGDSVLLQQDAQFSEIYSVTDHLRVESLAKLFILFLVTILIISSWAGLRSLLGLLFSFVVIFTFVLPQIIAGTHPLTVALMASLLILFVSYYLTHGIHDKSTIAIVGTFGALTLTGILAIAFTGLSRLTGLVMKMSHF
jgi:uncharacterized membrane protein